MLEHFAANLRAQKIYQQLFALACQAKVSLYLVGGVVRDLFFHRVSPDLDLTVSDKPLVFAAAYARRIKGSYILLDESEQIARVVYRKQITIDFTRLRGTSIEADLGERDFTINAMALSFTECMTSDTPRLIDPYGGWADLQQGIIRLVSPHSITADPLRMVRAYRFAAQFGFTLLPETEGEIAKRVALLKHIAAERVHDEILKLFTTPWVTCTLERMAHTDLFFHIFPELRRAEETIPLSEIWRHLQSLEQVLHTPEEPCGAVAERIRQYVTEAPHRLPLLKLAMLFSRAGHYAKLQAQESAMWWKTVGERLRFSKADRRFVHTLILYHPTPQHLQWLEGTPLIQGLYDLVKVAGEAVIGLLLLEMGSICLQAQEGERQHFVHFVQQSCHLLDTWILPTLKQPRLLNGNDLQTVFGLQPGPHFSTLLQETEAAEIRGEFHTKAEAVAWASTRFGLAFSQQR
jgi:tRNA nucleotidyltransferase/poly(A) polymerase